MTVIVGLIDQGKVYLGGDSAAVGDYIMARNDQKVFKNGEYLIGFTTSYRMGQLLRYQFIPPELNTWDVEKFMATDFIESVRSCFERFGYGQKDLGGSFLVGIRDRLFYVDPDFHSGFSSYGYESVGCGSPFALGSLHSTVGEDPTIRVTKALSAAVEFSTGCCGPFTVISNE